jgi:hypothetical protein
MNPLHEWKARPDTVERAKTSARVQTNIANSG